MPTQTSLTAVPSGEQLYNSLMSRIETDLVTSELPKLDAKYKNETPEQSKARAKRYELAFAEYEKQLNAYLATLQKEAHTYKRTALKSAEQEEKQKEDVELDSLTQAISNI